jgi:hypothetical protein
VKNVNIFHLEYFELNKRDEKAHNYFYHQIPGQYVWKNKRWETRQEHFNTLGRMYHVSPNQGDLFYLRILLCNVKGATDFSELYSFENIVYATYKEACFARGLIKGKIFFIISNKFSYKMTPSG